jgi:cellobiose phosphorylase
MKIQNDIGLSVDFLETGLVRQVAADGIRISLKPAHPAHSWGANLYLRKGLGNIKYTALTGPGSNTRFRLGEGCYEAEGVWEGVEFNVKLILSTQTHAWIWQAELYNKTGDHAEYDLVLMQDVGMKADSPGLVNEYYVSQYLERIILEDQSYGAVVCCRQNMREATGNPWLILNCLNGALSGSTDGMQFFGKKFRETGQPEGLLKATLGGNYAGESPVVALQEKPFQLKPGDRHQSVFLTAWQPDHPEATSVKDLELLPGLIAAFTPERSGYPWGDWHSSGSNLFTSAPFLPVEDLSGDEISLFFSQEIRRAEVFEGQLLSFFYGENRHVMLKAKEILTDRPHGHIMHTGSELYPDENIMSDTAYACGVFNSHISQGNTNFSVLLSVNTSPFNTSVESGQRIFVETGGRYYLLGIPSAFEMGLHHCRWIYKSAGNAFEVRTMVSVHTPEIWTEFRVLEGEDVRLIITHDFDALNGWSFMPGSKDGEFIFRPDPGSMLAGKFPEARFRMRIETPGARMKSDGSQLFMIETEKTSTFAMTFIGEVVRSFDTTQTSIGESRWDLGKAESEALWRKLSLGLDIRTGNRDLKAIGEILPWFAMNSLTHYLTPYGLEQFSGAAWGTRDVSQGPVDLLLTLGFHSEVRQILRIIFSNQNPDGGWPQWWMFDSFPGIRAHDSHGDVVYWVLIAVGNYIRITGDLSILEERVPYFSHVKDSCEPTTVLEHVGRVVAMVRQSFIPGTSLVPFGGGDWNDSLQPVSADLASRMVSSWTVEMNYQAFRQIAYVYSKAGLEKESAELNEVCSHILEDFNRHLVTNGIVAGYGLDEKNRSFTPMLHPEDHKTGVSYSLLPMERGILSGLFTPDQARSHQKLIESHLKGPDGARLMDKPLKYKGGIQTIFQRAESSTFFGREIGLMYIHEHIRYAESLAVTGQPEAFVKALRQAIPVDYRQIVPGSDLRQSNCYYSSSDVVFETRYEADERYADVIKGNYTLRGGWRVYSSGPGIFINLFITKLLGIRLESDRLILDPVMPQSMDGSEVTLNLLGCRVAIRYHVKGTGFSPKDIRINKHNLDYRLEENPYRSGGAVIPLEVLKPLMAGNLNHLEIGL